MTMTKFYQISSLLIVLGLTFYPVRLTSAVSSGDLQDQIEEKNEELQGLSTQIQQTQSQIITLQGESQTLSQAVSAINSQIDQVNYSIRSSEVSIEKFALELQSLGFELEDVAAEIDIKQRALADILREVQQNDREGLLEVLLKHDSLADSVFIVQSLSDLQDNLNLSVAQLAGLQLALQRNVDQSSLKKGQLEDETVTLKGRGEILEDQEVEKDRLLRETKNEESVYQVRLAKLRKEQQSILDEISDIEEQLKKGFDSSSIPSNRPGLFTWPVVLKTEGGVGIITQNYGETAYSTRFYKGKPHNGMDIGAPIGTQVRAASDGKVVRVDYNGWYYQYGRYILIDHGNNITTLYAHLSQSAVSSGQTVKKGQLIGYVGNTGFSTGAHLHFGAYATPSLGWREIASRTEGGLISIPPATGLVPIGVTLDPSDYL